MSTTSLEKLPIFVKVLAIITSAVLLFVVVFLLNNLFNLVSRAIVPSNQESARHVEILKERLQPIGSVNVGKVVETVAAAQSPDQIYETLCKTCHEMGVAGAPKTGDHAAWQTRLNERTLEGLVNNANKGFNGMPAKGGNPKLSDAEVAATVHYLLEKAGITLEKKSEEKEAENSETTEPNPAASVTSNDAVATQTSSVSKTDETSTPSPSTVQQELVSQQQATIDLALGEKVYNTLCTVCHQSGIGGAVAITDQANWQQRLNERGVSGLLNSSLNGYNAMPAKGGNPTLTDEEVTSAVHFMLKQAGISQ